MKMLERRHASAKLQQRAVSLQIKAVGDEGVIEGYGSVFGVRDSYDDVIAKGAFAATIAAHKAAGTMPAMLWQHDASEPVGVFTDMSEDDTGLKITGRLCMEIDSGRKALALIKMSAISGLSIGFISRQWSYDQETDIRTLTEIDLWEVSLVTFPANGKARITGVKADLAFQTIKDAERSLREAGFSKAEATAFVSRAMRMGEERREAAQSTAKAMGAADRLLKALTTT